MFYCGSVSCFLGNYKPEAPLCIDCMQDNNITEPSSYVSKRPLAERPFLPSSQYQAGGSSNAINVNKRPKLDSTSSINSDGGFVVRSTGTLTKDISLPEPRLANSAKPEGYKCSLCDHPSLKTSVLLSNHIDNKNLQIKLYQCDFTDGNGIICNKLLSTKSNLNAHKKLHTTKITQVFKCEYCHAEFNYKHNLTKHKKSLHSEDSGDIKCEYCFAGFKKATNKTRHVQVEHLKIRKPLKYILAQRKNGQSDGHNSSTKK